MCKNKTKVCKNQMACDARLEFSAETAFGKKLSLGLFVLASMDL